ncbi:MAG: SDR family NAD(P)-dependent oxidoreductase [Pseudolabrys sp.]|nr:SDR family NAD(P)-dependent oxidoreductase [Pseudolabrys sp.]
MSENVFLTGGAGFIGTALARHFLDRGARVTIFDVYVRDAMHYFPEIAAHPNLRRIKGDVRDLAALKEAVGDATLVFHLAAIAGVSKYFRIPAEVMEINVLGTYNVLEAIKDNRNVRAFFDFSTSEIYGSNCFGAREDGDVKMENIFAKRWTYATSKMASEKFGMAYYWQYGVPFVGVRPFNVYGPGQVGEGVISYFLNACLKQETIKITGDGSQCRTYCYVDDFVDGIRVLVDNVDKAIGTSFNIGRSTEMYSVLSLAQLVQEIAGMPQSVEYVQHAGDDVMVRSPSVAKLTALGYKPKIDLREGLTRTLDWYRTHQVTLD